MVMWGLVRYLKFKESRKLDFASFHGEKAMKYIWSGELVVLELDVTFASTISIIMWLLQCASFE